ILPAGGVPLFGSETIGLDPRTSFLHTRQDSAVDAVPIVLADLGIQPGDLIRLQALGDFDYGPGGDTGLNMIAVFSSSGVLLVENFLNRVPDAIDSGEDYVTQCTFNNCEPTDIPQDFGVAAANGSFTHACIVVPMGATHLFVGAADSYYRDNSDPDGDYALQITQANDPDGECCGPTNMLVNGGFETGDFSGWVVTGAGSAELAATADGPQSGTYAALWAPAGQDVEAWLSQSFVPMPSQRISEVSFWARRDNAAPSNQSGALYLRYSDGTADSEDMSVGETWEQFDFTSLLDPQRELSSIEVFLVGPSEDVFLDDLVVAVGALEITCPSDWSAACDESTDPFDGEVPSTSGGCGEIEFSSSDSVTAGGCPNAFTIARTWTATDDAGNVVSCNQTIDVQDTNVPQVTVPARDREVECDGSGNAKEFEAWLSENGGAEAADACGDVAWSHADAVKLDGCAGDGSVSVTFLATDACGNSSETAASFVIADNHAPRVECPEDMVVRPTGTDGVAVSYDAAAEDHCDDAPSVEFSPTSGATFGIGTSTTVVCTATDACGNSTACRFTVHVQTLEETLESLIDEVDELVRFDVLNRGQGNSLTKKLEAVIKRLADGRTRAACNMLRAFINQVTDLIATGVLTSEAGQPLIDATTDIYHAAGCNDDQPPGEDGGLRRDDAKGAPVPGELVNQCGTGVATVGALLLTLLMMQTGRRRRCRADRRSSVRQVGHA
ncbi:MAG: HYR domain-containing protein, partial [Planctomycetota bacterium]|nr:HYR domain-containing protein [Planctomycetota bacterium]